MKTAAELRDVTQLGIDYLTDLDYVDLKNLCSANQYYNNTICNDNTILRQILYNTVSELYLPANFNIANALDELYASIKLLVNDNYPSDMYYPKWVNRNLLIDDVIRKIYVDLYHIITELFYEIKVTNKINIVDTIIDVVNTNLKEVHINKALISFPFAAHEAGGSELYYESNIKDNEALKYIFNKLIIPQSFRNYIITPIIKWFQIEKGYGQLSENGIQDLMFIREETRQTTR